jgi:hypothetical protein
VEEQHKLGFPPDYHVAIQRNALLSLSKKPSGLS